MELKALCRAVNWELCAEERSSPKTAAWQNEGWPGWRPIKTVDKKRVVNTCGMKS